MISFFNRTFIRLNGCESEVDSLNEISLKRSSSTTHSLNLIMFDSRPATKMLMPSWLSKIVPFNSSESHLCLNGCRRLFRSGIVMNLYPAILRYFSVMIDPLAFHSYLHRLTTPVVATCERMSPALPESARRYTRRRCHLPSLVFIGF